MNVERALNITVSAVGAAECTEEGKQCEGSCTARITVSPKGHTVSANSTVLTGPKVTRSTECVCGARDFRRPETCQTHPCLNGGSCLETQYGPTCSCPKNYEGPRCQQMSREFHGSGWAWYPGLAICSESHVSLDFITTSSDGLLLYNGPIAPPNPSRKLVSDPQLVSQVFKTVKRFEETRTVKDRERSGRPKSATNEQKSLDVLQTFVENPSTLARVAAEDLDMSHTSELNVLYKNKYHPFKVTLTQELAEDDFDRRTEFCEIIMRKCDKIQNFLSSIFFF
ncbi:beta-catenin binding [Homalodisca vitripennis]|nr:beta-catenin binding [Homalodisca vitripennis]